MLSWRLCFSMLFSDDAIFDAIIIDADIYLFHFHYFLRHLDYADISAYLLTSSASHYFWHCLSCRCHLHIRIYIRIYHLLFPHLPHIFDISFLHQASHFLYLIVISSFIWETLSLIHFLSFWHLYYIYFHRAIIDISLYFHIDIYITFIFALLIISTFLFAMPFSDAH